MYERSLNADDTDELLTFDERMAQEEVCAECIRGRVDEGERRGRRE